MRMIFNGVTENQCMEKLKELLIDLKSKKMPKPNEGFIYSVIVQAEKKELIVTFKNNNLEAYGKIRYTKAITYNLKRSSENLFEIYEIEDECKPFSREGLIHEMLLKGIKVGVIDKGIDELLNFPNKEVLIAKGIQRIDDVEDRIVPKFKNKSRNVEEESIESVDFRNLYSIATAKAGTIIGEVIKGQVGKDGIDVLGKILKKKNKKRINLVAGVGCKIVDDKVISTIDGRPAISGQVFNVFSVYKISSNVNMKSGNIDFIGDVYIDGGVEEGMRVSGNSINIGGNIEGATISGKDEVNIKGNILRGKINAGAEDVEKSKCLHLLESYRCEVEALILGVKQLKEYNDFMAKKNDGELIKLLIDGKFKEITRNTMQIIACSVTGIIEQSEIADIIKSKFIGLGPLSIKFVNDLYELIELLDKEIERLKNEVNIKVNININYCQDSVINASGDIIIVGKGQYISKIKSLGNIIFTYERAVCRGGILEAEESIVAKEVGTSSGTITNLKVKKNGIITAKTVYHNTIFTIGEKSFVFEDDFKNIKAYINKYGELEVEKIRI